ncbi:DUF4416 family protein [Candidatus Woesearchaeota archaeon]|nr:DUF4416 family protein [Candidatus Woesearchaeota archaeon]
MNNLLIAVMYQNRKSLDAAINILEQHFGPIKAKSKEYNFNFTNYYEKEFGKSLKKTILIFEKTIEKSDLPEIREKTGEIEQQLSMHSKRTVNIDPGSISGSELVLATKKAKPWKEHLGKGIYAHKILEFKYGNITAFKNTFADYKTKQNIDFFRKVINTANNS